MDKDDPFNRPPHQQGGENDFEDDARYDDAITPAVREEEYAAGQEEWDQPIDELAEEEQHLETPPPPKRDPFAEAGPVEDEYADHTAHDHDVEHEGEHDHDAELHHEHDPEVDGPEMQAPPRAAAGGLKPPANLMKLLPVVGGGIAAIVVAFFAYQQFAGGSSTSPTQPSLENQNTWDLQPAPTQHAANEFQQPVATPAQPELTPNNTQPAPPSSGSNVITPITAPAVQQPQQAPLPVAAVPNPLEGRVAELTAQLEQMKHTQDDLTQKLQTATQTPPSMDENSKAATQALNDRIAQLEQKLATASTGAQTTTATTTSQSVDAPTSKASRKAARDAARQAAREEARAARVAAADRAPAETAPRKSKHTSTDFMAVKKSKAAKKRRAAEEKAADGFEPIASAPFQGWILRSAQPGSAWLSQGPYSSDLRRVVPGDKVQGLGTVTSIHQSAGRWVVEGTQGAVR